MYSSLTFKKTTQTKMTLVVSSWIAYLCPKKLQQTNLNSFCMIIYTGNGQIYIYHDKEPSRYVCIISLLFVDIVIVYIQ